MTPRRWSDDDVRRLDVGGETRLRAELDEQVRKGSPDARAAARKVLATLDRIGPSTRRVEDRTDDARRFLSGDSHERRDVRRRAWASAVSLYGEREAERRGYRRPPGEAA
jgi:hypothetical protein